MDDVLKRHFNGTESEKDRTIQATAIGRAAHCGQRIDLHKAIVEGRLEFRGDTFEADVCFVECVFTDCVSFPQCTFNANLDLSRSVFRKECNFRAATIGGELRLTGAKSLGPVARFEDAHVQGVVWADRVTFQSAARFRRAKFDKSAFFRHTRFGGTANFEEAQFCGEAAFNGAKFLQQANFSSARVTGQAGFTGATFKKKVSFNGARIESHAFFRLGSGAKPSVTRFEGEADFTAVQIGLNADFRGAHFEQRADFNSMQVGGDAQFWSENGVSPVVTVFEQEADFTGIHVGGSADFSGAIFGSSFLKPSLLERNHAYPVAPNSEEALHTVRQHKSEDLAKQISFNDATFVSHARFSSIASTEAGHKALVTSFGLDADFTSATVGGLALFQGVEFHRKANFNSVHVAGNAIFSSLARKALLHTIFVGQADFTGVEVLGNLTFQGAEFRDQASFEGMDIRGIANFRCTNFQGPIVFDHARFGQDAHFEGTPLRQRFSFRETSFRVVNFSASGKVGKQEQFQGPLDLRGCVYERIQVNWERLLTKPDHGPRIEFDLQPYNQLEKIFRSVGKDRDADKIYLERCRVERRERWKRGTGVMRLGWFSSAVYGILANYGVRPIRLAAYSLALVLFGAVIFSQYDAVRPSKEDGKEPHQVVQSSAPISPKADSALQPRLSFWGAAAVSVHQFLPIDIPCGADWKPSGAIMIHFMPSDLYGSILKIAGWIFVPLGVAAVTGLLRRVVR
jgi:uncharacterized protein YjbI with pentapeptide repeats